MATTDFDAFVRMQMVGLFLSPVFYGMSLALAAGCIRVLVRRRPSAHVSKHYSLPGGSPPPFPPTHHTGARTRLALLLYVIFMIGCTSAALGQDVMWMRKCEQQRLVFATLRAGDGNADGPETPHAPTQDVLNHIRIGGPALVLAVWASSIFLALQTWRCVVLGKRIKSALAREGLNIVMYLLIATLIAAGVLHFFKGSHVGDVPDEALLVLVTPGITASLSLILALHGILFQVYLRHKPHASKLAATTRSILQLTIDSGSLIVVNSILYASLFFSDASRGAEVVFRILLPHICAISTLLIAQSVVRMDVNDWVSRGGPTKH